MSKLLSFFANFSTSPNGKAEQGGKRDLAQVQDVNHLQRRERAERSPQQVSQHQTLQEPVRGLAGRKAFTMVKWKTETTSALPDTSTRDLKGGHGNISLLNVLFCYS